MGETHDTPDLKYVRDVLAKEIDHRRTRREQIFTWASTLLVSVLGGTIGLTHATKGALPLAQRIVISVVSLGLGVYAWDWSRYHWESEQQAPQAIKERNSTLSIPGKIDEPSTRRADLWHLWVLGILVVLALSAAFIPYP